MASASTPWRRRLSELGRATGNAHAPLFLPLLYGVAAQIEALPPAEVTADPTRLGKCLIELRHVVGVESFVVAAPTAMEAEALGASVDREQWPPKVLGQAPPEITSVSEFDELWLRSEALTASLETCRRLSMTQQGEPVIVAALTGPRTLLGELFGGEISDDAWDFVGRALSTLSRQFAQSGASAIVLCERELASNGEAWSSAMRTISNIARFHRIPAMLAFSGTQPTDWPTTVVACLSPEDEPRFSTPHAMAVSADPLTWGELLGNTGKARVVLTAQDVVADIPMETLRDCCEQALEMEQQEAS